MEKFTSRLTLISLEHVFNMTNVALRTVKSVHEIAGCSQSCVRFLLRQRTTQYSTYYEKSLKKIEFLCTVAQESFGIRGNTLYTVSRDFCTALCTVIPQLTSDHANEFFGQRIFFSLFFLDSANECFSGCAR